MTNSLRYNFRSHIEEDRLAADIKLSLFSAALHSYRFDSVLRPFPQAYIKHGEKQIEQLRQSFHHVPSVSDILQKETQLPCQSLNLLQWLLVEDNSMMHLKVLPMSKFDEILSHTGSHCYTTRPSLIFEVLCGEKLHIGNNFNEMKKQYGYFFGYHGSSVENFFSILHSGLLSHLNNRSVFGEGTYLSTDLAVSINFSKLGSTWKNSMIATSLSCVLVCEIVKHPRIQAELKNNSGVPEKYILMKDNECLRAKYILVYPGAKSSSIRQSPNAGSFCLKYMFYLIIAVYIISLIAVGFFSKSKVTFQ